MAGGRSDAVVLIGHEGFASIEVFLGSDSPTRCAVVQSAGWAYQVRRESLQQECERGGSLRSILLRYTQSYMTQVAQTVVCNRHHSVDQQLSRWLLMFLDRQRSSDLPITQERIAALIGVRRESISESAGRLQSGGSIRYHRGHVSVVDRALLESLSCECYGIAKREADRLAGITRHHAQLPAVNATTQRFRSGPAACIATALSTNCA
jgi:Mn-dependent DtxR family transcriptional regulator